MEKAREFVEKFYNDDEFAKEAIRAGGLYKSQKGMSEEESKLLIVNAAKKAGYDINSEEYETANRAYFSEIGTLSALKKAFHLIKLMKAVSKEEK